MKSGLPTAHLEWRTRQPLQGRECGGSLNSQEKLMKVFFAAAIASVILAGAVSPAMAYHHCHWHHHHRVCR
jgi:hypothetical protein